MDAHKAIQNKLFDKNFRKELRSNPKQVLFDAKVKVVTNTKDTIYVVIPSQKIPAEVLGGVSAAGCANCASSIWRNPYSHDPFVIGATVHVSGTVVN